MREGPSYLWEDEEGGAGAVDPLEVSVSCLPLHGEWSRARHYVEFQSDTHTHTQTHKPPSPPPHHHHHTSTDGAAPVAGGGPAGQPLAAPHQPPRPGPSVPCPRAHSIHPSVKPNTNHLTIFVPNKIAAAGERPGARPVAACAEREAPADRPGVWGHGRLALRQPHHGAVAGGGGVIGCGWAWVCVARIWDESSEKGHWIGRMID